MKKLKYILAVALISMLGSCEDSFLDTMSEASVTPEDALSSTTGAKLALNGICRLFCSQYIGTQGINGEGSIKHYWGSCFGQDYFSSNRTGYSNGPVGKFYTNDTSYWDYFPWDYYYKIVSNANAIANAFAEENWENVEGQEAQKAYVRAQALTFRAYAYFQLVQFYDKRWKDSNNGASRGLPLRLDSSTGDLAPSTLAVVAQQIKDDLDEAIKRFAECGVKRDASEFYLPDYSVACALRCRVAMWQQDWPKAVECADNAVKGYSMMSPDEYCSGFNEPNSEWIWGVFNDETQNIAFYAYYAYVGSNASSSVCKSTPIAINKRLFDLIPDSDPRKRAIFFTLIPGVEDTKTVDSKLKITATSYQVTAGKGYTRWKTEYKDKLDVSASGAINSKCFAYMSFKFLNKMDPGVGHFSLIRYSEMLLNKAEALCMQGGHDSEVQAILQKFYDKYSWNKTCSATGDDLLSEVKVYRRWELWGEGQDWFDLKRRGESFEREQFKIDSKTFENTGGSFFPNIAGVFGPNDWNNWCWVYPFKETAYNGLAKQTMEGNDMPGNE